MATHNWSGVYKHESDENLEAYERARAQQLTEDQLKVILDQHPVVEIRQDGDNFYMKTTLNFRPVQELKFTLGQEWYTTTPDGRKISNVFLADGNRLIQRQTDEQENFIEYIREFKNDKMYLRKELARSIIRRTRRGPLIVKFAFFEEELRRGPVVARRCFRKVPGL